MPTLTYTSNMEFFMVLGILLIHLLLMFKNGITTFHLVELIYGFFFPLRSFLEGSMDQQSKSHFLKIVFFFNLEKIQTNVNFSVPLFSCSLIVTKMQKCNKCETIFWFCGIQFWPYHGYVILNNSVCCFRR